MKARVSDLVIEELGIRADCLEEETPITAGVLRTAILKIKAGEKPSAEELQVIDEEMMSVEDSDLFTENWKDWYAAMAWFGLLTKYDPDATYSGRKPRRLKIDGVEYERWV